MKMSGAKVGLIVACLVVALLPLLMGNYGVSLLNDIGLSILVVLGLILLTGAGAVTSFGQAAFVGVAAYTTAILSTQFGLSPWLGLFAALAITGATALIIGGLTLHMGGHFLALSTIAWGIAVPIVFGDLKMLGSHTGILNIPALNVGSFSFSDPKHMYYLVWVIVALVTLFTANVLNSRTGRVLRSVRGGPVLLASFGASSYRAKLTLFVYAALLAGLAGWLYAHMHRYVSPSAFSVEAGIEYLLMAVVGGVGSLAGAFAGSAVVLELRNLLQDFLPMVTDHAAHLTAIVFFVSFILLMHFARFGIMGFINRWLDGRTDNADDEPVVDVSDQQASGLATRSKPNKGATILSVDKVVKRFGGLVAVNEVSFDIKAGDIVGLIGPNGAGKSTMFNLLTKTLKSTSGKVQFLGKDISRLNQRQVAKMGMARTFQHVKLRPNMSLIQNVALGANIRASSGFIRGGLRLNRDEESKIFRAAQRQLERTGMGNIPHVKAGELPLGNQRILEIARALCADPSLLVLDEPAAGLRRSEKANLAKLLHKLRDEGVTILIVEHDMEFVMGLVDRLIVMNFGTKLVEGTPEVVRANEDVQAAYLGGVD